MSAPVDPQPPAYGFPAGVWRALERGRPPGPLTRPGLFRSPLRGPWLTSVFGAVLLVGLPIMIVTGLLSYAAYEPRFAGNAFPRDVGWLHLPHFPWPTSPSWLYRLNQGVHVGLGLALVPVGWPSSGRSSRSCSPGRRPGRWPGCSSGCRCCCSSAASCSSWSPGS